MTMITTSVEMVTPDRAVEMLKFNTRNRPVKPHAVNRYASDMRNGRWQYNGQDIVFSDDGVLLDGQHRLLAVVAADMAVPIGIKRGLPAEVFATIDAGTPRGAGDILAMCNVLNYNAVAAIARMAVLFSASRSINEQVSRTEVTEFVLSEPSLQDALNAAKRAKAVVNTTSTAAVLFLANKAGLYADEIDEFVTGVASGANLELGDPRLALRTWSINERSKNRGIINPVACFSAVARAWTAFATNEELRLIKIMRQPHRSTTIVAGFNS